MNTINFAQDLNNKYVLGVEIEDGLYRSQKEIIKNIEFAVNSEFLSGKTDELGRYKPYFNIVNFRLDVAVRATDLDIKDFQIISDSPVHADKTKLLRKEFYEWAKKSRLGQTLNDFGRRRAKYGGVILKKIEKDGELKLETLDWRNIVTDQVDITKGAIMERHFLSPVELASKIDIWDNVKEALADISTKKKAVSRKNDNQYNEDKVEVWELHAELPKSFLKECKGIDWDENDDYKYSNQVYFIYVKNGKPKDIFYCEEEKKSPYKYLSYKPRDGFGLGVGIVEEGLEAQRVINNYVISQYNAMELAGKTALITDSDTVTNNALTDLQTGDFIKINQGEQITSLNLAPSAFPAFTGLIEQWDNQVQRATNTYEAVTGETMPSGTPFRSLAIQNQEGSSLFSYRLEEAGLFWEDVVNDWIFPFLIKKLRPKHILSADFTGEELQAIDNAIVTRKANEKAIDKVLNGDIVTPEEYQKFISTYSAQMQTLGEKRFIDIPEGYYDDFEGYCTVLITNEKKNKAVTLESLSNILAQVANAPQILQDPTLFKIFAQIIELSGADISAIDLRPTTPQVPAPQQDNQEQAQQEPQQ